MGFTDHIGSIIGDVWDGLKEHSHTVMAIGAVAGLAGSIILTYKKAPKIKKIVEEQRDKVEEVECRADRQEISEEERKAERKEITKETIKRLAPEVAPIALCSAGTAGLMIGSAVVSEMKLGHVRDLLSISEAYNSEIMNKMREELGEEKAQEITNKVSEDRAREQHEKDIQTPGWESGVLQAKGGGRTLYWDRYMGRKFYCDELTLEKAVMAVNKKIQNESQWYPLKEIYYELELPIGEAAGFIGAGGMHCDVESYNLSLNHAIKLDDSTSAIEFMFWHDPQAEHKRW